MNSFSNRQSIPYLRRNRIACKRFTNQIGVTLHSGFFTSVKRAVKPCKDMKNTTYHYVVSFITHKYSYT